MVFVYYLLQHLCSLEKNKRAKIQIISFFNSCQSNTFIRFFHTQPHLFSRTSASSTLPFHSLFRGSACGVLLYLPPVPRAVVRHIVPQTALTLFVCLGLLKYHLSEVRHENHHLLKYGAMPKLHAALRFLPFTSTLTSSPATTPQSPRTEPSTTSVRSWPSHSSS